MSRPKSLKTAEVLALLILGLLLILASWFGVLPDYISRQGHHTASYWALMAALVILPSSILGYIRKNIAQKHGDWRILLLVTFIIGVLIYCLTLRT